MHESVSFITFDIKFFLCKQKLLFCLVAIGIPQREVDGISEVCSLQQNLVTLQSKFGATSEYPTTHALLKSTVTVVCGQQLASRVICATTVRNPVVDE